MEASNQATNILKTAILLERRGKAFYTQVARQSESKSAKRIFEMMAEEEDAHIDFLSRQYVHFEKTHEFLKLDEHQEVDDADVVMILSNEIKKEISAASFEAAAISAAIDFEKRAVEVYAKQAGTTSDPNEKALYSWLSDWEKGHLKILSDMDNELKEKIWNDNQFWPF